MTLKKNIMLVSLALFLTVLSGASGAVDNWPQWRGPHQNGIFDGTGLPLKWSLTENIKWKTALPSWSAATPIIWEDHVFVTSPSKAETKPAQAEQAPAPQQGRRRRASRSAGQ